MVNNGLCGLQDPSYNVGPARHHSFWYTTNLEIIRGYNRSLSLFRRFRRTKRRWLTTRQPSLNGLCSRPCLCQRRSWANWANWAMITPRPGLRWSLTTCFLLFGNLSQGMPRDAKRCLAVRYQSKAGSNAKVLKRSRCHWFPWQVASAKINTPPCSCFNTEWQKVTTNMT